MNPPDPPSSPPPPGSEGRPQQQIVIRQLPPPPQRRWGVRLLSIALLFSIFYIITLWAVYHEYYTNVTPPKERFHSGDREAEDKIALLEVSGTIMPPFTERILQAIDRSRTDRNVKAVVVVVDSPGGLVADSHQIYHRLKRLSEEKPVNVAMQRMAASGGYYVAMGAGSHAKIFAEPTTWTGSIGVVIPRYDVSELAKKMGVEPDPLTTGEFKDALNPLRKLTDREREVWQAIIDDAYNRFVQVIVDNRPDLEEDAVRKLATGEVYTAMQAKKNGLVDEIGYVEEAAEQLKQLLGLKQARIITYDTEPTLKELLLSSAEADLPENRWRALMEATVPQAMYFCSWSPGLKGW